MKSGSKLLSALIFLALLAVSYAYCLRMTQLEPVMGDCWGARVKAQAGFSLAEIYERMRMNHNLVNPRLAQLFTILTSYPHVHALLTPLAVVGTWLLVLVHALGRLPRVGSMRDAFLLMAVLGCTWLAVPNPGETLYYRPVLTNYVYSVGLVLLFLLPFRLGIELGSRSTAAWMAVGFWISGIAVGKLNEHLGPTLLIFTSIATWLALRRGNLRDAVWKGAATLGIALGFLLLFFAPGQQQRYDGLGERSVWETVSERGLEGNLEILGKFAGAVAPLLTLLALLLALHFLSRARVATTESSAVRDGWPLAYLVAAVLITGTALAAPIHITRLFIAPSFLLVILVVSILDRLPLDPWMRAGAGLAGLLIHAAYMSVCLDLYARIHEEELLRFESAAAAEPGTTLRVRPFHEKGSALFYGDTLPDNPQHQRMMAEFYGLEGVIITTSKEKEDTGNRRKNRKKRSR